jgi:uncharacterized protein (DUF2141 family)
LGHSLHRGAAAAALEQLHEIAEIRRQRLKATGDLTLHLNDIMSKQGSFTKETPCIEVNKS